MLSECTIKTDLYDQELKEHGNESFPIACYNDDLSLENVIWHWHEEWEIVIVDKGSPEFSMENHHFLLQEGDGILINSKALHAIKNNVKAPGELVSLVFHPRLIGGNTDSIFWQQLVQPFMVNSSTRFVVLKAEEPWAGRVIQDIRTAWHMLSEEEENFEISVRFYLSKAVSEIIKNTDFSSSKLSEQEILQTNRIRTMMEFVEEHYQEDIRVTDISQSIAASESVCVRCFREMLDTTPMQYVKQVRIKKAEHQLLHTKKTAKEIALDCGFNDISYFTRTFRDIYQCTPGMYRRKHH